MKRRIPTQRRAEETVGCLYEAVARILEQGNDARLTTNHIAEKAGVSIGSLYEYFSDRSALLDAMARRETALQRERVERLLIDSSMCASPDALIRYVVRSALRPFATRPKVRQHLMRFVLRDAAMLDAARDERERVLAHLLAALAERWPDRVVSISEDARFTLATAIVSAVRAVALERPAYFETQEFEDDIVGIVVQRTTLPVAPKSP